MASDAEKIEYGFPLDAPPPLLPGKRPHPHHMNSMVMNGQGQTIPGHAGDLTRSDAFLKGKPVLQRLPQYATSMRGGD